MRIEVRDKPVASLIVHGGADRTTARGVERVPWQRVGEIRWH
jgi:hypothetical protein